MLLSEVSWRLNHGRGVPEKTVVLVFDPGHRQTYQIVKPILAQHHWPAVWLTNGSAMKRGHREYVTYHTAEKMRASGWWDVGYSDEKGNFALKTLRYGTLHLGD